MILNFLEKYFGGHFTVGNLTVFGWNAMHVTFQYWSKSCGYICFHPPGWLLGYGKYWAWKFYISPNATPWAAWVAFGPGISKEEKQNSEIRRRTYVDINKLYYDGGWRIKD